MKEHNSKCKLPDINLQSISYPSMKSFRTVLKRELIEFENKMRGENPQFDVYEWLGNLLEYNPSTVRKWLNEFDQTGTKIGLKDLQLICVYLNTIRPAEAFLCETSQILNNQKTSKVEENIVESLKDGGLKGSFLSGQACNKILEALEDKLLEPYERAAINSAIDENIELWQQLGKKISEA